MRLQLVYLSMVWHGQRLTHWVDLMWGCCATSWSLVWTPTIELDSLLDNTPLPGLPF